MSFDYNEIEAGIKELIDESLDYTNVGYSSSTVRGCLDNLDDWIDDRRERLGLENSDEIQSLAEFQQALRKFQESYSAVEKLLSEDLRAARQSCPHRWEYQYTGRHGRDKGVRFFKCRTCGVMETKS